MLFEQWSKSSILWERKYEQENLLGNIGDNYATLRWREYAFMVNLTTRQWPKTYGSCGKAVVCDKKYDSARVTIGVPGSKSNWKSLV